MVLLLEDGGDIKQELGLRDMDSVHFTIDTK